MEIQVGKQSLAFAEAPYIISSASIVGKKEGEGPLGNRFDVVGEDDKFGQNTWEEAESTLQKEAFTLAVGKAGLKTEDIRYLFSGDLLGQNIATSFGLMDYQVPLFGLYGACSTCGEALSLGRDVRGGGVCGLCCGDDVEPILPARKSSSVFHWNMPTSARNRRRGRSREVAPMCSGKKEARRASRGSRPVRSLITASRIR